MAELKERIRNRPNRRRIIDTGKKPERKPRRRKPRKSSRPAPEPIAIPEEPDEIDAEELAPYQPAKCASPHCQYTGQLRAYDLHATGLCYVCCMKTGIAPCPQCGTDELYDIDDWP